MNLSILFGLLPLVVAALVLRALFRIAAALEGLLDRFDRFLERPREDS